MERQTFDLTKELARYGAKFHTIYNHLEVLGTEEGFRDYFRCLAGPPSNPTGAEADIAIFNGEVEVKFKLPDRHMDPNYVDKLSGKIESQNGTITNSFRHKGNYVFQFSLPLA